jgi:hypothetical protein
MKMDKKHYFNFLEDLRGSGATNMFGAAPYLTDVFGLDRQVARDILLEWMQLPRSPDGKVLPDAT